MFIPKKFLLFSFLDDREERSDGSLFLLGLVPLEKKGDSVPNFGSCKPSKSRWPKFFPLQFRSENMRETLRNWQLALLKQVMNGSAGVLRIAGGTKCFGKAHF